MSVSRWEMARVSRFIVQHPRKSNSRFRLTISSRFYHPFPLQPFHSLSYPSQSCNPLCSLPIIYPHANPTVRSRAKHPSVDLASSNTQSSQPRFLLLTYPPLAPTSQSLQRTQDPSLTSNSSGPSSSTSRTLGLRKPC
jgi:hypothetical protein